MIVEVAIDGRRPDRHIRMAFHEIRDAFVGAASRQTTLRVLRTALFEALHGGDHRIGGGEHGINHDDQAVGEIARGLEVVFDRLQRLWVA